MRIGLLECDHVHERYLAIAGDYSDMFRAMAAAADPTVDLVPYDVRGGVHPSRPDECDGWLLTGSSASVYDVEPWIDRVSHFLRAVHDARAPCVGVCFGHQLLAHALGGRTERAEGGWGVGALPMTVVGQEPWMDPVLPTATLLYSHQDQVTQLPPDGRVLASAPHCPVAMLAVGDHTIGIQAHPEFGPAYVHTLLEDRVDRIGERATETALATLGAPTDEHSAARWIVGFLRSRRSGHIGCSLDRRGHRREVRGERSEALDDLRHPAPGRHHDAPKGVLRMQARHSSQERSPPG